MFGKLTNEGAKLALELTFKNEGAAPGSVYLGLITNDGEVPNKELVLSDLGETVMEEVDTNYSRQEVNFGNAQQKTIDVNGENVTIKEINSENQITFGPWDIDSEISVAYAFLTDSSSGDLLEDETTPGKTLAVYELPDARILKSGDTLTVPVNELSIGLD